MNTYTKSASGATAPDSSPSVSNRRADFARQAVFEDFRPSNARAIDQGDFKDREPESGPRQIGQVAAKITNETGQKAVRHWLNQAARAETDEDRAVALKIADEIADLMGLDPIGRRAA